MIKVGLVGCGGIANTHMWALSQIEDASIVGFADVKKERAVDFANRYAGVAGIYESLSDMLADAKPDIVHICTPHYLHVPMAIECLKAGVNVFSEKPPAISGEQFEELGKIASASKARLGFCFQNRYNNSIKRIDELIVTKSLGAVMGARAFVTWRRDEGYYETDWKGALATEGGGALINQSIHTLDLMLRYLGTPTEVKATVSNHHLSGVIEVEDTVEAWMNFSGGKRACFYASNGYVTDAPIMLEIQCEKGTITLLDKALVIKEADGPTRYEEIEEPKGIGKSYWGSGHMACIKDFYSCVSENKPFRNDWEGVKNTFETMMRIYDFR